MSNTKIALAFAAAAVVVGVVVYRKSKRLPLIPGTKHVYSAAELSPSGKAATRLVTQGAARF
ncbi:MAG TPA: hypothetical protein VN646_16875 [Candidatus Acidoferrum sp.]|nr:hypothetical protein [Candidatus Acidoferrum sp.]